MRSGPEAGGPTAVPAKGLPGLKGLQAKAPDASLEDVAAAIRAELRLEAEEAEREAALSAALQRSLAQVAAELMAHGDTVAVDVGDQGVLVGTIAGAGTDYLTLASGSSRVDVAIRALLRMRVLERPRAGGLRFTPGTAASLRARLLELQLSGQPVEVGVAGIDEPVTGPICLVGSDHVAIGDEGGPEWFLPFRSLAFVKTRDAGDWS